FFIKRRIANWNEIRDCRVIPRCPSYFPLIRKLNVVEDTPEPTLFVKEDLAKAFIIGRGPCTEAVFARKRELISHLNFFISRLQSNNLDCSTLVPLISSRRDSFTHRSAVIQLHWTTP